MAPIVQVIQSAPFSPGDVDRKSLDLDGSTEYLRNATNQSIGIANAWTVAIWVKPSALDANELLLTFRSSADVKSSLELELQGAVVNDPLRVITVNSAVTILIKDYKWNGFFTVDAWTYAVVTWDGTDLLAYFNGNLTTVDATPTDNTGTMADADRSTGIGVGGHDASQPFSGRIHSAAVWDSVLSSNDITTTYNAGDGFSFDFSKNRGTYNSASDLKHWWQAGQPSDATFPGSTYVRDKISSGGIDVAVNSANITDADIVDDFPGK